MSWRTKEDLGTELVAHVHESMRIPNDFTTDIVRGFQWWASDYAQRIWADLGNFHNATTLYRLHCETDFVRGSGHAGEAEEAMMQLMGEGSLSAIIYDAEQDCFKFHCCVYAHYDNENWVKKVFNAAAALQVSAVQRQANRFARDFKMAHAMTEHPNHGARKEPDQICHFEDRYFKPHGAGNSKWMGEEEEWEQGRQALRRLAIDVKTDHKLCLEATFDWSFGQRDMSLLVSAVDPHPELGNGLMLALTLPVMMDGSHKAHVAMLLNDRERNEWNWYNDLGSWCYRGGELTFACFVPNICYLPGVLHDFAHDMGLRANWVNEHWPQIVKSEWVSN